MSKPWGGIGAWAADAEAEEREEAAAAATAAAAAASGAGVSQNFPSLKESITAKPKKKKLTLSEFTTGVYVGPGGGSRRDSSADVKGLTPDEMLRLPTGPKERSPDELYGRIGGGFSGYDRSGGAGGRPRDRDGDGGGSWGGGGGRRPYGGGYDDDRRAPPPRVSEFDQPSRADEVDNWALGKKSLPSSSMDSGRDSGRSNRYGSLGGGMGGGGSKADEVDNWAIGKKQQDPIRSNTFGSGFRGSPAPEPDRWSRGGVGERRGLGEQDRERPRLVLDPPRGDVGVNESAKSNRANPFGAARPREQVLAEKGLDWKKLESDIEAKKETSRPSSSHSSRPSSAQSSRSEALSTQGLEGTPKPRPKVNPFGDAKPREVLLEQKGKDWRKIDLELEHRGVDRSETEGEKILKEEIDHLKKQLGKKSSLQEGSEDVNNLHNVILEKERDLELLILELDDKVRFREKAVERPGSGAGRPGSGPGSRPSSRSGSFVDEPPANIEFFDRPRSRGTGDAWSRPVDDRRAFQGGRERGYFGNRDMDRPRSRERW